MATHRDVIIAAAVAEHLKYDIQALPEAADTDLTRNMVYEFAVQSLLSRGRIKLPFKTQEAISIVDKIIDGKFDNFEKGKITVKIPTPLLKNSSASITIKNFVTGNITKPKISSGWSFINQAESFINLINSKKNKKNYATGQNSLDDIKIIESIF